MSVLHDCRGVFCLFKFLFVVKEQFFPPFIVTQHHSLYFNWVFLAIIWTLCFKYPILPWKSKIDMIVSCKEEQFSLKLCFMSHTRPRCKACFVLYFISHIHQTWVLFPFCFTFPNFFFGHFYLFLFYLLFCFLCWNLELTFFCKVRF